MNALTEASTLGIIRTEAEADVAALAAASAVA
jgi:hypothetical protein